MLYLITGTDTEKARAKLNAAVEKNAKEKVVIRITDAHTLADLEAALGGAGMFGGDRVVVLDNALENEEMRTVVLQRLPQLQKSPDVSMIYHTALDAATRKQIEMYVESSERHDAPKSVKQETIFGLVRLLQSGKKKDLWVGYRRELLRGKSPEAMHGILFYAAKDSLLRNPKDARARALVAQLAELPHEARRAGFDLEYALEHFVLTRV